jgi:hypothetical protein
MNGRDQLGTYEWGVRFAVSEVTGWIERSAFRFKL